MKRLSATRIVDLVMLGTIALCAVVILAMGTQLIDFKNTVTDQIEIQEEN